MTYKALAKATEAFTAALGESRYGAEHWCVAGRSVTLYIGGCDVSVAFEDQRSNRRNWITITDRPNVAPTLRAAQEALARRGSCTIDVAVEAAMLFLTEGFPI